MTNRERLKQFILAEIKPIEAAEPDEELLKVLYLAVDGLDNLDFGQTDEIFAAADLGTRVCFRLPRNDAKPRQLDTFFC